MEQTWEEQSATDTHGSSAALKHRAISYRSDHCACTLSKQWWTIFGDVDLSIYRVNAFVSTKLSSQNVGLTVLSMHICMRECRGHPFKFLQVPFLKVMEREQWTCSHVTFGDTKVFFRTGVRGNTWRNVWKQTRSSWGHRGVSIGKRHTLTCFCWYGFGWFGFELVVFRLPFSTGMLCATGCVCSVCGLFPWHLYVCFFSWSRAENKNSCFRDPYAPEA